MSDSKKFNTPGVYLQENAAVPTAIVPVATDLPVFIGYTAKAEEDEKTVTGVAVRIDSFGAFERIFGGRKAPAGGALPFLLYDSVRLFYLNGGGNCFVVSVGGYGAGIALAPLLKAVVTATQAAATMTVVPDAVRLPPADFSTLAEAMLADASGSMARIALLDVPAGESSKPGEAYGPAHAQGVAEFRTAVGMTGLDYGAAYFPFLLCQLDDGTRVQVPASGAVAGIIAQVDRTQGVNTAPANVSISGIIGPSVKVDDPDQEQLNLDPASGKSVNAIRLFTGRGTLVWGARTLDGNSQDWRYIQVRRTVIYLEQSIRAALHPFVFEPNVAATWQTATGLIDGFLIEQWKQGKLQGAKAADAFSVQCGLGTTMTAEDIEAGLLKASILVAVAHPAEFIVITIQEQMQPS